MNIYITQENEKWLRMQGTSMSGIVNQFLDEARAGKRGPHVLAEYDTLEENMHSDNIRPDLPPVAPKPKESPAPVRTAAKVYGEIVALKDMLEKEKRDNELNQDPDYWDDYNARYAQIQDLWDEFNSLKGK